MEQLRHALESEQLARTAAGLQQSIGTQGQVIAGYQLQSAIAGNFTAGNFNASLVGPFTATGSASAAATYTDRPTVIYSPLTGVDFLKRLMTPVPPSSVLFMLQSGYSAERVIMSISSFLPE